MLMVGQSPNAAATGLMGPSGMGGKLNRRMFLVEPLGYLELLSLMSEARLVFTDSGGIQMDTTMLSVPCLTLRTTPCVL